MVELWIGYFICAVGVAFLVTFLFCAARECWWEYRQARRERAHGGFIYDRNKERLP